MMELLGWCRQCWIVSQDNSLDNMLIECQEVLVSFWKESTARRDVLAGSEDHLFSCSADSEHDAVYPVYPVSIPQRDGRDMGVAGALPGRPG
eukprot:5098278-Amphidinium_carterae.1